MSSNKNISDKELALISPESIIDYMRRFGDGKYISDFNGGMSFIYKFYGRTFLIPKDKECDDYSVCIDIIINSLSECLGKDFNDVLNELYCVQYDSIAIRVGTLFNQRAVSLHKSNLLLSCLISLIEAVSLISVKKHIFSEQEKKINKEIIERDFFKKAFTIKSGQMLWVAFPPIQFDGSNDAHTPESPATQIYMNIFDAISDLSLETKTFVSLGGEANLFTSKSINERPLEYFKILTSLTGLFDAIGLNSLELKFFSSSTRQVREADGIIVFTSKQIECLRGYTRNGRDDSQ